MSKYVDLDKVIDKLEDEWGYEGIREDLYELPSASVVEVVRCKDCKHKGESDDGYPMCMLFQKTKVFVELGHYCSRGERKETDE